MQKAKMKILTKKKEEKKRRLTQENQLKSSQFPMVDRDIHDDEVFKKLVQTSLKPMNLTRKQLERCT